MSGFESECSVPSEHPYAQLGYDFMGACFEVHRTLGGGLLDEIYQESLELELMLQGINHIPKQALTVFYKGHPLKKRYIPDLVVSGHIVVEIKSVGSWAKEHEAQLLNYMRITRQPVGYLVNFAPLHKLEWKRMVLSEFVANDANSLAIAE